MMLRAKKRTLPKAPKRWVWQCCWENGASSWQDSEKCRAGSKKPVSEVAAKQAAGAHENRTGHHGRVHVRPLFKNQRWK